MLDALVLIGPHSSGKTTLGRMISERLGWPFHDEIGKRLRWEALAQDPDAHALRPQPDFDREVTARELARDAAYQGGPRIVETWHPGNLAYAQSRSPQLTATLYEQIRHSLRGQDLSRIWVQPLQISPTALSQRINEPGPDTDDFAEGLLQVGLLMTLFAYDMGLHVLPPLRTDDTTPAEVCEQLLAALPLGQKPAEVGDQKGDRSCSV